MALQKLNSQKSGVEPQAFIRPYPLTGRNLDIINSVELNILIGRRKMKSRFVGFTVLIVLTLFAAFFAWNVAQMSFIPAAVQAAHERGERLPAYQILGVDLASYRLVWVLWSVGAV